MKRPVERRWQRWVALSVMPVFFAGIITMLVLHRRLGIQIENPIEHASLFLGFGAFAAVGSILMAKRPRNPIGWIMAAAGLMVGVFPAGDAYAGYVMSTSERPNALAIAGAWVGAWYWFALLALIFVFLPLLFPKMLAGCIVVVGLLAVRPPDRRVGADLANGFRKPPRSVWRRTENG